MYKGYTETLFSHQKEGNADTYYHTDKLCGHEGN
jgi:hypothetical protein